MKQIKKMALVIGVMAIGIFIAPVLARAENFGIVDMNRVMKETTVAKDILTQLEGRRKEYQEQIAKEANDLRLAERQVEQQKDTLSKVEYDKKRFEIEQKVTAAQKSVDFRKHVLDQAFNSSMQTMRREAAKIVSDIAKEKNYSAVLTQDAVMVSLPELDMTDGVVAQMNKNVKKIAVDWKAAEDTVKKEMQDASSPDDSEKK